MDVVLVMFKADGTRRDFPIRKDRVVIGRKNSCGLRIPLSAISRQHCEVQVTEDGIVLKDLGSSNGTYHNSIRVQEAELTAGDELSVGPVVFTVVVNGKPADIRPVRTVLDPAAAAQESEPASQVDEIADLPIDENVDLTHELNDELASADQLATPSIDEPPVAGLDDSDLELDVNVGGASSDDSDLDLAALFGADDDAGDAKDKPSQGTGGASSILEFDFDQLDEI